MNSGEHLLSKYFICNLINKEKAGAVSGNKIKMIRIELNVVRWKPLLEKKNIVRNFWNRQNLEKTNIDRRDETYNSYLTFLNLTQMNLIAFYFQPRPPWTSDNFIKKVLIFSYISFWYIRPPFFRPFVERKWQE